MGLLLSCFLVNSCPVFDSRRGDKITVKFPFEEQETAQVEIFKSPSVHFNIIVHISKKGVY